MPQAHSQLSTQVTDLSKKLKNTQDLMDTYGEGIVEKLEQIFSERLPRQFLLKMAKELESGKYFGVILELVTIWTQTQAERLEEADLNVFRENREDKQAEMELYDSVNTSRQGTIRLKRVLSGIYGEEILQVVGLSGETPEDRVLLLRLLKASHKVVHGLKELPPPIDEDMPAWGLDKLKARLVKLCGPLEKANANIGKEKKETQEARLERVTELNKTRILLNIFNTLLEGYARLAERKDIADRIRPSGGRPPKRSTESNKPQEVNTPAQNSESTSPAE